MGNEARRGSFWTTLPGILAAIAGLMTATGTLVGALYAAGVIGAEPAAGKAAVVTTTRAGTRKDPSAQSRQDRSQAARGENRPSGTATNDRGQSGSGSSGTTSTDSGNDVVDPSRLAQYVGTWTNDDPNTSGVTSIEITQADEGLDIHPFGKCHPTDCDWGTRQATVAQEPFDVLFDFGSGLTHELTLRLEDASGGSLKVVDVGSRSGTNTYLFHK
jgi:hypothetical protein